MVIRGSRAVALLCRDCLFVVVVSGGHLLVCFTLKMIHRNREDPCAQHLPLQLELLGKEQHFKAWSNKVTVRRITLL